MAWIITRDFTPHGNSVGRCRTGYGTVFHFTPNRLRHPWQATHCSFMPYRFRLLRAGKVLYLGQTTEQSFDPLDLFGASQSDCTSIEYWRNGRWVEIDRPDWTPPNRQRLLQLAWS